MHNNDLITGGVGIVFGRLDAKNAFKKNPIKFVSFVIYPSEGLRRRLVRGDREAAAEKSDTVRNRNQSESFQAWTHIQPYVASVLSGQTQGARKATCPPSAYKTRTTYWWSELLLRDVRPFDVFFSHLHSFLRLCFQGFSLLSRFNRKWEIFLFLVLMIAWLSGLRRALNKVQLRALGSFLSTKEDQDFSTIRGRTFEKNEPGVLLWNLLHLEALIHAFGHFFS